MVTKKSQLQSLQAYVNLLYYYRFQSHFASKLQNKNFVNRNCTAEQEVRNSESQICNNNKDCYLSEVNVFFSTVLGVSWWNTSVKDNWRNHNIYTITETDELRLLFLYRPGQGVKAIQRKFMWEMRWMRKALEDKQLNAVKLHKSGGECGKKKSFIAW